MDAKEGAGRGQGANLMNWRLQRHPSGHDTTVRANEAALISATERLKAKGCAVRVTSADNAKSIARH